MPTAMSIPPNCAAMNAGTPAGAIPAKCPRRHALGAGLDEQPKHVEAIVLSERGQRRDRI